MGPGVNQLKGFDVSYTIDDLNRAITKQYDEEFDGDFEYYDDAGSSEWGNLEEDIYTWRKDEEKTAELEGIGTVRLIESFGGEGEGDNYYLIVSITDSDGGVRFFKRLGWYASYDGGHYEGPTVEVESKQKTITVYEQIK